MEDEEEETTSTEISAEHPQRDILKKVAKVALRAGAVGAVTGAGIGFNSLLHVSSSSQEGTQAGSFAAVQTPSAEQNLSHEEKASKELNSVISFLGNSQNQDLENLANRSSALLTIGKLGTGIVNGKKPIETQILGGGNPQEGWKIVLSDKVLSENRLSEDDWAFYLFKESLILPIADDLQGSTLERINAFEAQKEMLDETSWKRTFETLGSLANNITDPDLISIRNKYMPPPPSPAPSSPNRGGIPV